jgi:glutamate decarboxylase
MNSLNKNGGDVEAQAVASRQHSLSPRSIENIIGEYFNYPVQNGTEVDNFRKGIQECIDMFMERENISSSSSMEQLNAAFKSSAIPDAPWPSSDYIKYLKEYVIPHSVNTAKPRFIGHMTSMLPLFYQELSRLMTAMNQNVVKVETSKVYTLIERQTLAMIHRLVFGFSESFYDRHVQDRESNLGLITSCGTLANITSLWIARNKALKSSDDFPGLQSDGFISAIKHYGYKDAVIIGSAKMHYSMDKVGSLLGLGAENIIKVVLNAAGSINVTALKEAIDECIKENRLIVAIVGIASATETGQIDDLSVMGEIARENGIHFHIDAAWGGPILFSDKNRKLLKGIELADSVTICGHKQLFLPMGISMALCKDPDSIQYIKAVTRYQARAESYDLGKHSPEGSRPAVSAYLHAGLHLMGKKGYAHLIDEGIRRAHLFTDLVRRHEAFELIEEPSSNIVVYRYIPEEMRHKMKDNSFSHEDHYVINSVNEVLQDQQFLRGHTFISRTTLEYTKYGKKFPIVVLRAVFANPLTTDDDLSAVLEDQLTTANIVLKEQHMSFAQILKLLYYQTSSFHRQ